jgi:alpha-N-arabinofuranosidase
MRSVTKDAKLFAAATSDKNWTLPLLKAAAPWLDYISIHGYWDPLYHRNNPAPYLKCMMKTDAPEADIRRAIDILKEAGQTDGRIKIAYDEWNLRNWHHPWHGNLRRGFDLEARRKNDIASTYTMADALFSACFLNACLRHADVVDIACFSPIVNTRGAIFVHEEGIVKRTTYHVLWMYANLLAGNVVPTEIQTDSLSYENRQTGLLDVVLTRSDDGRRLVYAVVNKSADADAELRLDFSLKEGRQPSRVKATVLSGTSPDDYNDKGRSSVIPREQTLKVKDGKVLIPAHSLTFVEL